MKYIKLKPLSKAELVYIKMRNSGPHPKAIIKEEIDKAERLKREAENNQFRGV